MRRGMKSGTSLPLLITVVVSNPPAYSVARVRTERRNASLASGVFPVAATIASRSGW